MSNFPANIGSSITFLMIAPEPSVAASTQPARQSAIRRLLRCWRERARERLDLSMLGARDFGDLAVPRSLIVDELRKWPWQRFSQQWGEIRSTSQPPSVNGTDRSYHYKRP